MGRIEDAPSVGGHLEPAGVLALVLAKGVAGECMCEQAGPPTAKRRRESLGQLQDDAIRLCAHDAAWDDDREAVGAYPPEENVRQALGELGGADVIDPRPGPLGRRALRFGTGCSQRPSVHLALAPRL